LKNSKRKIRASVMVSCGDVCMQMNLKISSLAFTQSVVGHSVETASSNLRHLQPCFQQTSRTCIDWSSSI